MEKWILAVCCAALPCTAWAQNGPYNYPLPAPLIPATGFQPQPKPEPIPPPVPTPTPTPVPPASGTVVGSPYSACANGSCGAKKVCMPEPSVKVKVSIKYSSVDEDKCWRTCFWPFGRDCDSCASGHGPRGTDSPNCNSHPYVKRYLVKRIVTEDIPITKCVPVEVPACRNGYSPQQCGEWLIPVRSGPAVTPIRPEAIPSPIPVPLK